MKPEKVSSAGNVASRVVLLKSAVGGETTHLARRCRILSRAAGIGGKRDHATGGENGRREGEPLRRTLKREEGKGYFECFF